MTFDFSARKTSFVALAAALLLSPFAVLAAEAPHPEKVSVAPGAVFAMPAETAS